jgi:histone H3/H4
MTLGAIVELDPGDMRFAENGVGVRPAANCDAALLHLALQEIARRRIELTLHQGRHEVEDRDVHALRLQARGGFEAE